MKPLAVFTPQIGTFSETFVRRHVRDLLPGGTAVVTGSVDRPFAGNWTVDGPMLVLNRLPDVGFWTRRLLAFRERFGLPLEAAPVFAARRFLTENGVRVILGEYLDIALSWLPLAEDLGIPFYAHAHGYDVSHRLRDSRWREDYLRYNRSAGIVAVSRASRARLVDLGLDPAKVHVVPCGVDVPPAPSERPLREAVRCLAVGRMVPKKAPILLLDAFRRALADDPRLRLDCVGDGPLLSAARQFVRAFGLDGNVTLHGACPSAVVQRMMGDADVFLQHSVTDPDSGDEEGLPVGILEAMAAALPVVSTRHAGIPEAVTEGKTGFLAGEGDTSGMADAVLRLARDPDLRRRMGAAGWERARDSFSWETERRDLIAILGLGAFGTAPPGSPARGRGC